MAVRGLRSLHRWGAQQLAMPPDAVEPILLCPRLFRLALSMCSSSICSPSDQLVDLAYQARSRSYSPYSNFAVGCVLLLDDGQHVLGCNVENASYGLTVCAERNALGSLISMGKPLAAVKELVVIGPDSVECAPCGACRQVIFELIPQAIVWYRNKNRWLKTTPGELLPAGFDSSALSATEMP